MKSAYDSSDGSLADPSFAAKYKGAGFNIGAMLKGLKVCTPTPSRKP